MTRGHDYTLACEAELRRNRPAQFMLDRLAEEEARCRRLPSVDGEFFLEQVRAKREIVKVYVASLVQSRPENPTLWGREARHGLYTAFLRLLTPHRNHPDFPEEA